MKQPDIEQVRKYAALIKKATNNNDHNEALRLWAELIGRDDYVKIMEHIAMIHRIEGHIPYFLMQYRDMDVRRCIYEASNCMLPIGFRDMINL